MRTNEGFKYSNSILFFKLRKDMKICFYLILKFKWFVLWADLNRKRKIFQQQQNDTSKLQVISNIESENLFFVAWSL